MQVPKSAAYGTHDLRRGHAKVSHLTWHYSIYHYFICFQDMQKSGATLRQICQAGPWRSSAVFKYLDECELEADVALEAAIHEGSDDEPI